MGSVYLFSLVVGLGILLAQAIMGSKDADADAHGDHDFDHDFDITDADVDGEFELDGELDPAAADGHAEHESDLGIGGLAAILLSVRFWIFAALGFGLSGSLLHFLFRYPEPGTLITAIVMSLVCGFGAALAFRAVKRSSGGHTEHATSAIGRIGKVLLPVATDRPGQIRIELGGQTVDLLAKSNGVRIERGDVVIVEDVDGEIATVSVAPKELR